MIRKILAFLAPVILVLLLTAPAWAFPQPPQHFYGTVYGAQPGDNITAEVNGRTAETVVDANNRYGYNPPFTVPAGDGTMIGGPTGETVYFYIDGELVGESPFVVWGVTQLDLVVSSQ